MEGRGVWFDTREEALAYVDTAQKRGARSFDIGCFQINHRWHGDAFASIDMMFDQSANADYAARFLSELFEEFGSWSLAAGAYHSRTQQYARKYRARFDRIRENLHKNEAAPLRIAREFAPLASELAKPPSVPRLNTFPLLQSAGGPISAGSLVPLEGLPATPPLMPAG